MKESTVSNFHKPLTKIIPGQKYWTFNPFFGRRAKIRFDIFRNHKINDHIARRQRFEMQLGLCFATKEDAIRAYNKLIQES